METACAFLNSDGGWLMFGIAPSLKIIGQNVTDNTRQEVANAIRKIKPAIDVEVEYIELPDKPDYYVIAIYFDSNNFKNGPYSFDGRAFCHNEIHNQANIITSQDKVFEFCKPPKSIVEIAEMLEVNDRRWGRKKYIAPYISTKLQMTIPDKPNNQNQKYVIIKE